MNPMSAVLLCKFLSVKLKITTSIKSDTYLAEMPHSTVSSCFFTWDFTVNPKWVLRAVSSRAFSVVHGEIYGHPARRASFQFLDYIVLLLQHGPDEFFSCVNPQAVEDQDYCPSGALRIPVRFQDPRLRTAS
jgi:hypothetical protein